MAYDLLSSIVCKTKRRYVLVMYRMLCLKWNNNGISHKRLKSQKKIFTCMIIIN